VTAAQVSLDALTAISRHMLSAICQDVGEYAALNESVKRDLVSVNVHTAQLFLEVVDQRRMPTDAQLEVLAAAARERFRQGVPLPSVLRAYRVGGHEMWRCISHDLPDLDHCLLADFTLCYINCTSTVAEHAYAAAQDDMLNSRSEATRILLSRLVQDDFASASERREAIQALGLDPDRPHVAVIIGLDYGVASPAEDTLADVLNDVRHVVPTAVSAALHRCAIALIPATHSSGVSALLRTAIPQRTPRAGAVTVGIGRPAAGDDGILATVREANRARVVGEILFRNLTVHEYDSLGCYDLFRHDEAVDEFVDGVLADFARHDEHSRGELIRTLLAYFTLGMNRRAAATRLGIHPNTLDYRLRKASEVAGVEVTDPELSFRFQLAVRLLPICAKKSWLTADMR
jgi:hypothetical protein